MWELSEEGSLEQEEVDDCEDYVHLWKELPKNSRLLGPHKSPW